MWWRQLGRRTNDANERSKLDRCDRVPGKVDFSHELSAYGCEIRGARAPHETIRPGTMIVTREHDGSLELTGRLVGWLACLELLLVLLLLPVLLVLVVLCFLAAIVPRRAPTRRTVRWM